MFSNIEAVLFDLDGTLVDSAPDLGAAANLLRAQRGLPDLPLLEYRSHAGAGARGMLKIAFDFGPEHPDFESLKQEFFDRYDKEMFVRTGPFEGVLSLIEQLTAAGLKWGVVTNKSERFTLPLTASFPVFSSAQAIISGDTTPHAKPHPAPLLEAARRMQIAPERCVYIGDDERDIVAGRAANMLTVAAAYGYLGAAADPLKWNADAVVHSVAEIGQLLGLAPIA